MCALRLVLSTSYKFSCKINSDLTKCYIPSTFLYIFCFNRLPLRVQFQLHCIYHLMMNVYCQNMVCTYKQKIGKYFR
jgi:hypothetical protein